MTKKTITLDENFFEHLLNCMANQKFIRETPPNGDALNLQQGEYEAIQKENQKVIDVAYRKARELLNNN